MLKMLLIVILWCWFNLLTALKLHIHQSTIISSPGNDVMLPVTYDADFLVRITWTRNQNCDMKDGFVWCSLCTFDSSQPSTRKGLQYHEKVVGFEKNGSIILKNVQLADAGHYCVKAENMDISRQDSKNAVYGIITLNITTIRVRRSVQCPVVQPGPASGIIALPLPGILINNVDFIHIPIVLNLSDWNMVETGLCMNTNISTLYKSLLKDIIRSYQERTKDSTEVPKTFTQSGTLHLSGSQQGLANLSKYTESQFEMSMSIWNKEDLETIMRHLNYFRKKTGESLAQPLLRGIQGLAGEKYYTTFNLNDVSEVSNQENHLSKEIFCAAYGNMILNKITTLIKDVENGCVPSFITDVEMAKLYCPDCISQTDNLNKFWGCVNSCKKLQFSTIRNLGSVTPHPNNIDCPSRSACSQTETMYISFTLSLPVYDLAMSVFDRLAAIKSVGVLEDSIFMERLAIPPMVIFHPVMVKWLSPNTDCCHIMGYKYICRCDIFHIEISVCGYDNPSSQSASKPVPMSCPVRLTKWHAPIVKVSRSIDGTYCIVTNHNIYSYGSLSCNITSPNFCFTPEERTTIGNTAIMPFTFPTTLNPDVNIHSPPFNVKITPLTSKLKSLMEHKNTHLIQITNNFQTEAQIVKEMISSADNDLLYNPISQVETRIKILIVIDVFVILIVLCMLYCFCNLVKKQGLSISSLFSNPYTRISN